MVVITPSFPSKGTPVDIRREGKYTICIAKNNDFKYY